MSAQRGSPRRFWIGYGSQRSVKSWYRPGGRNTLSTISRSTVQRLLKRFRQDTSKLLRSRPHPPNRLLRQASMERLSWDTKAPGNLETDLAHHCGRVPADDYPHILQLVDVATGCSQPVAVLGRSQEATVRGFMKVQNRPRGYGQVAAVPIRRTTTGSWNGRTASWYGHMLAMSDWIMAPSARQSTPFTTICVHTTACFSP